MWQFQMQSFSDKLFTNNFRKCSNTFLCNRVLQSDETQTYDLKLALKSDKATPGMFEKVHSKSSLTICSNEKKTC